MKLKVVYESRLIAWKNAMQKGSGIFTNGMVLYPFVLLAAPKDQVRWQSLFHEMVHVRQIRSDGWLKFYLRYAFEYLGARFRGESHYPAYLAISYEEEARRLAPGFEFTLEERAELGL